MPTVAVPHDPSTERAVLDGCRKLLASILGQESDDLLDQVSDLMGLRAPIERPRRLRQSLLATFDRCALSARFALDYEEGWSTHDQARGQLFHRVAARCLNLMADTGAPNLATEAFGGQTQIPVDAALEVLEDVLRQADVDRECHSCGFPGPEPIGGGRFRCRDCGRVAESDMVPIPAEQVAQLRISVKTWAANNAFNVEDLVSVEERIRVPISYEVDGTIVQRELSGALDALFFAGDRAIVLDWKDTWALPPETELSFTGYFQQRFYAFLVMSKYRAVQSVTLREHYVRYTEFREATVDRSEMDDLRAELSALAERFDRAFEHDAWKPAPGKHCSYCPRPTACPIFPDARGEGAIAGEDQARRYAAEAAVAESALKQRKAAMKAWASAHGFIPLADAKGPRAWGFVPARRKTSPDADAVKRELALASVEHRPPNIEGLWGEKHGTKFEMFVPAPAEVTDDDRELADALEASLDRGGEPE